ncbi:MAG: biotin--[acetyl-CoA-carboxylase] ligase [Salinivirgaceae bacterium]|nr:MAG: biotin--[acetyl-CoA-carboxylase] ligase [Salinivirgaceae bacterium]
MTKLNFEFQDSVISTNNVLKSDRSAQEGSVLIAGEQTQGKGMGSNQWESRKDENITGSIVLEPIFLEPSQAFLISMAVSCGLIEFLSKFEIEAKIKWPNDIYIDNKKIAGILIENEFTSRQINKTIVGIGFNVNQEVFEHAPNPTSLKILTNHEHPVKMLAEKLFEMVINSYELLRVNKKVIMERYHNHLLGLNQYLLFDDENSKFAGKIKSVAEDGQILIIDESRKEHKYYFKEVEMLL